MKTQLWTKKNLLDTSIYINVLNNAFKEELLILEKYLIFQIG